MKKLRKFVYQTVENGEGQRSRVFNGIIIFMILLSTLAIVLESEQEIFEPYQQIFHDFDIFSVIVFSIEYLLRVWTITENPKYSHPIKGRIQYMLSGYALIDLFAILPFFTHFIAIDLRFIRVFRLLRIFRILKIARYISAIGLIVNVFKEKKEQLMVCIIFILFLILISSCLMYYIENPEQPKVFTSIPRTAWWAVVTLASVGYGDMYPITAIGRFLGGIIALLGIGLFALPAGILASGFSKIVFKSTRVCPKCGLEYDDSRIHHE